MTLPKPTPVLVCALALATSACGEEQAAVPPGLELTTITDLDPGEGVVEINLVAKPGETSFRDGAAAGIWGYADGSVDPVRALVPGPLIEARQGDTVIVHFTNLLSEGTTIHWHG